MIYSAGRTCPVCYDSSDIIFLKSVASGQVFFCCYSCGCAWDYLPTDEAFLDSTPLDLAPEGFALADLNDIEAAGFVSLIAEELSDDDLLFDSDEGFIPPERNPQDYDGKTLAVHFANPLPNGEKDWGVLFGKSRVEEDKLILDIDSEPKKLEILREWLCRIKPTYSKVSPYCEAELDLSLALRAFPNDTPPSELMEMANRRKAKNASK
jgi:hypothetical protein